MYTKNKDKHIEAMSKHSLDRRILLATVIKNINKIRDTPISVDTTKR